MEAGRVDTFLGRERDRIAKEAVKREGEVSGVRTWELHVFIIGRMFLLDVTRVQGPGGRGDR